MGCKVYVGVGFSVNGVGWRVEGLDLFQGGREREREHIKHIHICDIFVSSLFPSTAAPRPLFPAPYPAHPSRPAFPWGGGVVSSSPTPPSPSSMMCMASHALHKKKKATSCAAFGFLSVMVIPTVGLKVVPRLASHARTRT